MNVTSLRIITIVVLSIAILAGMAVGALAYCLISGHQPNEVLLAAFISISSGLVGALTGLLVNTRTQPPASGNEPPNQTEK